ncbi:MAG: hypothetical protein N5P05_000909 [Chroococcopsis gigantea SAG 12.99]|jgi:4-amino-4-deoxy-L-arabinose transferase-like glycosyltransferase|nr:glycosyltransferase family 39 protein [Chlorogloea purpurea SAG 13.99]MDV2999303.1 hypothetical protein [Chroococcopsis gigantea SAG 12.99]
MGIVKIDRTAGLVLLWGLLFRLFVAFWLYPGYDEAYYYIYSHELAWSYFDHPFLVALSTGLGTWITGMVNQFTIRWGVLLLYTGSLWLLYLTALKLFDLKTARLTLLIASLNPVFAIVFGILTLPDAPLIFFWSATVYVAALEFFPGTDTYRPTYRVSLIGLCVGLAVLGKYHGFILGLGLVLFCLSIPRYRAVFTSPWMGLSATLFLLCLFPIVYWNNQHDWISFRFHLDDRFKSKPRSFNILGVLAAFGISAAAMFPTIGLPLWWVGFQRSREQIPTFFSGKSLADRTQLFDKRWLLLCVSLPLILFMLYVSGSHYLAPSWILPGFWSLTILLGEKAARWQEVSRVKVRRWLKYSGITIVTLLMITLAHLNLGIFQKPGQYSILGGVISPRQDPSNEVVDIEQLKRAFQDNPVLATALNNSQFMFTHLYLLGGWIDMALHPLKPIPVTCFCNDKRGFAVWVDHKELVGKNGLFMTIENYIGDKNLTQRYKEYFQSFQYVATVPIKRGGTTLTNFYVYQGTNLLKPYP